MPRIPLITSKEQVPADRHAEFDEIVKVLNRVGGPFGVLMYSPGLAEMVCKTGAHVRLKSSLTMKQRELAIIAVSREKDAAYEWAAHVRVGRENGLSEETIEAVRHRKDVTRLDPDDRDIVTYVRQLLQKNKVEQTLFDDLVKRHDVRWLVELTATIGQYQYISAINNAFDLQPAADADQLGP